MTILLHATGVVLGLFLMLAAPAAEAGLYWFHNVRGKTVSLCFVGDAVTKRPDRVDEIRRHLREFENSINVRFDYLGPCPDSVVQPDGSDFFDGDVRVALRYTTGTKVSTWPGEEGTGPVPGRGCHAFLDTYGNYKSGNDPNDGWGSWANAPDDLAKNRACLYNLKLGDDPQPTTPTNPPYLNHTLHEFGHALGLRHEHERDDVDKTCTAPGYGGDANDGHMTPYDRRSVMNYQFATCGINGNYDYTGLSDLDRVALRILYPEDNRLAEYVGTTVLRAGEAVVLQSGWKARDANLDFVAKDFRWVVNGKTVSSPDLSVTLSVGSYPFQYSYRDFLDRSYSTGGTIAVLSPADYDGLMAATRAAQLPLF
jgi:hypothetical protein